MKIYRSAKGDIVFATSAKIAKDRFEAWTEMTGRGRWCVYRDAPSDVVEALDRYASMGAAVVIFEEAL